jgi:hypothetical protein
MNLAWRTGFSITTLTLLLGGCQRDNPEFDADTGQADTSTDGGTTTNNTTTSTTQSTTTTTMTGDGDGAPGDGDGDGTPGDGDGGPGDGDGGPGDGDGAVDSGMEAPIELDMPLPACFVPTNLPLNPRFGTPAQMEGGVCAPEVGRWIHAAGVQNGNLLVNPCTLGCVTCQANVLMEMGAQPLFIKDAFPIPGPYNQGQPSVGCYYVEAAGLIADEPSGCYYAALSVHAGMGGPLGPLQFHANRDNWGLTPSAADLFNGWHPPLVDQDADQCACEELEIECCPGQTVVAKKFQLGNNLFVAPPNEAPLNLIANNQQQVALTFYGAQAQSGTNCEVDPETSWAIFPTP